MRDVVPLIRCATAAAGSQLLRLPTEGRACCAALLAANIVNVNTSTNLVPRVYPDIAHVGESVRRAVRAPAMPHNIVAPINLRIVDQRLSLDEICTNKSSGSSSIQ
jgi:hypothetical protein